MSSRLHPRVKSVNKITGYKILNETFSGVQELIVSCVRESDSQSVSPYLCPIETRPVLLTRTCNDVPCPPRWNYSDFQECSKPCGIGIQLRDVTCIHEVARGGGNTVVVPNFMCPQPPPQDRQSCNVLDCPVKWHPGEWSKVKSPTTLDISTDYLLANRVYWLRNYYQLYLA